MAMDLLALKASKKYTEETVLGGGAVVGKNVTVSSITKIDGGNRVEFSYTLDDGTVKTSSMDVMDGKDKVYTGTTKPTNEDVTVWINPEGIASSNPILNVKVDGKWVGISGLKGADGVSPTAIVVKDGNKSTLTVTDVNGTTSVEILDGSGGSVSVEANPELNGNEEILNSIKINGIDYYINELDEKHYNYMYNDVHIIPDKYNTGVDNSIQLEAETLYIDLNGKEYKNETGVIVYENKDFSASDALIPNGWGYVGEGLKLVFNNCKFRKFRQAYDAPKVEIEFNNCTFMMMTTAYRSTFNKCFFGNFDKNVDSDACNPRINCVLNDCYIADVVVRTDAQGEDHIDGTQVLNGDNVEFNNCRWECPDINYTYKQGGVSYAVYLQNSTNCKINNCYINGGGIYSISSTVEGNVIKNTFIGQSFVGNAFYPSHKAELENIDLFNSLYVSSVWKDENNYLHFLISNDTKIDREITVLTNLGVTKFVIPRTYTPNEYEVDTKNFVDLPIDIEKVIESNVDYAVFFENGRQIRFVNFTQFEVVKNNLDVLNISASEKKYRWQYVEGIVSPKSLYNYKTKTLDGAGNQYTSIQYILNGEKKIRFSGATSGSSAKLAYAFLDSNGNVISIPPFISGQIFNDVVLDVPKNSYEIRINGNNYASAHIEVAAEDLMADTHTLPYLLNNICKKIQYKDTFAWKPMDTGYIAFTFDDSLDDIASVVDLFISKGVPCCFGAIPEKLNMSLSSGETIAQAMKRGIDTVGCEVLAHGSSIAEIVTSDNIDDMNFLYNKFVVNKQKFLDMGFDVRGTVRVGGSGNICNDPRTDVWCRTFFDYGDLYGLEEPYNHSRFSGSTAEAYYEAIDKAINQKAFTPLLFHTADLEELPNMIDYVINNGGKIVTYATAYDTFGSTVETVDILNRISAIENSDGNEVMY